MFTYFKIWNIYKKLDFFIHSMKPLNIREAPGLVSRTEPAKGPPYPLAGPANLEEQKENSCG